MISRIISPEIRKSQKSILLIGPRQTGKSTLISSLKPDLSINLSDELEYMNHSSNPSELGKFIEIQKAKSIFIDEVQRIPKILNTVQSFVDKDKSLKFYLTGSSARKLKRGGGNLLPGRILNYYLGPLVSSELNYKMNTAHALSRGCLPEIYLSSQKDSWEKLLMSYAANYLKEEIKAEALVRNLESFARFLQEVTLSVAQFVDYNKISKSAKISRHAVPRYFEILEDTLVGSRVFPYPELMASEDLIKHPKFYFFDNGVYNGLLKNFVASADRIGKLTEQLVFNQMLHSSWAHDKNCEFFTFRTRKGIEVDFVIKVENKIFGIEVKNSENLNSEDFDGLSYLQKVVPSSKSFILHMGSKEKKWGSFWSLPWQMGLKELGL